MFNAVLLQMKTHLINHVSFILSLHVSLYIYIANLHCHHELCQFEYISIHSILQPTCNCVSQALSENIHSLSLSLCMSCIVCVG